MDNTIFLHGIRERERDRETERQRETERDRDRQTDRQPDRQTNRQTDRDRDRDRQTDRVSVLVSGRGGYIMKRVCKPLPVQELCESRGGRPGLSVLMSLLVSVDV